MRLAAARSEDGDLVVNKVVSLLQLLQGNVGQGIKLGVDIFVPLGDDGLTDTNLTVTNITIFGLDSFEKNIEKLIY